MLLCDHDSSSDASSSEDDLEDLLLTLNEKPKRILGPRLNLEDLTNLECEQLFRLVLAVQSCVLLVLSVKMTEVHFIDSRMMIWHAYQLHCT